MEEEYLFKSTLFKEEEDNELLEPDGEEFLKPSKILIFEEELDELPPIVEKTKDEIIPLNKEKKRKNEYIPKTIEKTKEKSPEIRLIENNRKELEELEEEELFTPAKLIYDDKELDNINEDEEENNYLFRPAELIYEDPLELFNKRREQGIVINSSPKQIDNDILSKEKKPVKTKPKSFLNSLKNEIFKKK